MERAKTVVTTPKPLPVEKTGTDWTVLMTLMKRS